MTWRILCYRFVVFADSEPVFMQVKSLQENWPLEYQKKMTMLYLPVFYPENRRRMVSLFKPCATARLFIPPMLPLEDAIIYIDTDFIFLRPPEDLWRLFKYFDSQQLASMGTYIKKHGESKQNKVLLLWVFIIEKMLMLALLLTITFYYTILLSLLIYFIYCLYLND